MTKTKCLSLKGEIKCSYCHHVALIDYSDEHVFLPGPKQRPD